MQIHVYFDSPVTMLFKVIWVMKIATYVDIKWLETNPYI